MIGRKVDVNTLSTDLLIRFCALSGSVIAFVPFSKNSKLKCKLDTILKGGKRKKKGCVI